MFPSHSHLLFLKLLCRRNFATAQKIVYDPEKLRNIALVAHIDSGKTTLTESILLRSSYISSAGSVDTGSSTTDFLPVERQRGITVQSASIPIKWKDWTFNLIDTPGHADFGMEVESASRVVDGAVVLLDSVEGVESQTKGVWSQLDRYGVPTRLLFLNKLDRPGASFHSSLVSLLTHRLHPKPMVLVLPIASFNPGNYTQAEPGIEGLVDLVQWTVWKWDKAGNSVCVPLPRTVDGLNECEFIPSSHPIISHLIPARIELLENLSMFSDDLMEMLLELSIDPSSYLKIDTKVILSHLRKATTSGSVLPVVCGSATKNIGTDLVMDYIGELLASPLDLPHYAQSKNASVSLLAWKVAWDKRRGWMTFVRVYSGKLSRHGALINTTRNKPERAHKLLLLYASEEQEVEYLPFGSVGVILGLKHTRTGDTLVSSGAPASFKTNMRDIIPPAAVISASVIPQTHADLTPVTAALEALSRTDPSVRVDIQEGQTLVHGLGALHLEIIEGRLRDEWGVQFEFGARRVSYREGIGSDHAKTGWQSWETDLGGKHVKITLPMDVRPLQSGEKGDPTWDGNLVVDSKGTQLPSPDSIPSTRLAHIAEGINTALSSSPNTSLPVTHVRVEVKENEIPSETPSNLFGAAAAILRRRLRDAGVGPVFEPFVSLKVSVNENSFGNVVKDIAEHGGEVQDLTTGSPFMADGADDLEGFQEAGVYVPPGWLSPSGPNFSSGKSSSSSQFKRSVHAMVPLSQFLDYSTRLRAISEGHGTFEMINAGYREVSYSRKQEILREIGRA